MPFALISFGEGAAKTVEMDALIDTGAFGVVFNIGDSEELVRMPIDEVRRQPSIPLSGLGGRARGYACTTTITLRGSSLSPNSLVLKDVIVYASDAVVPYDILIGQRFGLEGKALTHRNFLNKKGLRWWSIRDMKPPAAAVDGLGNAA